jgi:hypothetical protein
MSKRDKIISELLKEVEKQSTEIKALEKEIRAFSPKTNLSIEFNNKVLNLHTLKPETLIKILANLRSEKADFNYICIQAGLDYVYEHSGYSYVDWHHDILMLIKKVEVRHKKRDLVNKEKILKEKYSQDKKDDITIAKIKEDLGL